MKSKISSSIISSTKKPALIPFVMSGHPSLELTKDILYAFQDKKVAAVELGIPFSDPLADGPVIQIAAKEALDNGVNIDKIFNLLEELKTDYKTPIILFSYYNPIMVYGVEKFIKRAKECNVAGFIIPDLPYEEALDINKNAKDVGIDHIMLIAPTSSEERIKKISAISSGFIYMVSSTGVTGVRDSFSEVLGETIKEIRKHTDTPIAVGFGISKSEHINSLKNMDVQGAIVGSAVVKIIQEYKDDKNTLLNKLGQYIDQLYVG